jgi:hypothetical protein
MKCKICNVKFIPTTFLAKCCSVEHSLEYIKIKQELIKKKALEENKKEEKVSNKIKKDKVTNWKNKLQTEVQLIARQIDYSLPCLATRKLGKMAGGHLWSKGSHPECRFNLHNIHRQCYFSNAKQSQDSLMWEGLIAEYGKDYHDMVKSFKGKPIPKLSDNEYKEAYNRSHEISKKLNRGLKIYNPLERVELRDQFNKQIGIYE